MDSIVHRFGLIFIMIYFYQIPNIYGQSSFKPSVYIGKDGLNNAVERQVLKAKNEFVWITTDNGLYRYDGNSFFCFKHKPNVITSIASNNCYSMLEDSKGRFWVNTDEGISLMDRKSGTFENYAPDTIVMPHLGLNYTQMAEDSKGNIWIGGYFDILIFDPINKKFCRSGWFEYAKNAGIIHSETRNSITQNIIKKSKEELWILSVYGLFSVNTVNRKYTYHPNPDISDYFAFYISDIDAYGNLWIATYDQCFFSYMPNSNSWKKHLCPPMSKNLPDQTISIKSFGRDSLIILRNDKLFIYDVKNEKFSNFEFELEDPRFPLMSWSNMEIVKNHLYVVSSQMDAFVHLRKQKNIFHKKKIPLPVGFNNNHSYITLTGKILAGDWSRGKIVVCDTNSCITISDQYNNQNCGALQLYFCSTNGKQYFSTSQGVFEWDDVSGKAIRYAIENLRKSETEFRNFTEDNYGNIYVRERNSGIYVLKSEQKKLEYLDTNISSSAYSALYYDFLTNKLWIGTEKNGLYVMDISNRKTKNYQLIHGKKSFINDIIGDKAGNVYLLMPSSGMMHIQSNGMKPKLYTVNDGMKSKAVRYGYVSSSGTLWFTTETGLTAFDTNTERFYNFDSEKKTELFNYRIFPDTNGFISQNSFPDHIITLDHTIIKDLNPKGKIYLKDVRLFDAALPIDSTFSLDYNQNYLSFTIGYVDQDFPSKPVLQYTVNDQKWQTLDDFSFSMFNINPGKYHIQVREKYNLVNVFSFNIIISPPWWKTKIFLGFLTILFFGVMYLLYRKHIQNIRREEANKNEVQQQMAKIEMAALRAQMNPHFIFNCLNSINRFILVNDMDAASSYLTKFSRLIRLILEVSKEDFIALDKELEALQLYIGMESMRFQDSFEWKIDIEAQVDVHNIFIPPLFLQPYVENAIWHGLMQALPEHGVKKLFVNVFVEDKPTIIEIIDNGIGREKAGQLKSKSCDQHKSYGISLSAERLKLMQNLHNAQSSISIIDLADGSGIPCGTKVRIELNTNS